MLFISHWKPGAAGRQDLLEEALPEWAVLHRKRELEAGEHHADISDINGCTVSPENLGASPAF